MSGTTEWETHIHGHRVVARLKDDKPRLVLFVENPSPRCGTVGQLVPIGKILLQAGRFVPTYTDRAARLILDEGLPGSLLSEIGNWGTSLLETARENVESLRPSE